MTEKFIQTQNLFSLLDPEPYFLLTALFLLAWSFYKFFLRDVSEERHRNLKSNFKNILHHYLIFSSSFAVFTLMHQAGADWSAKSLPYVAVFTLIWGMVVFVKTCSLIILQYMFLGSMRTGVPILIVNIFSFLLSVVLVLWTASQVFGFQVAPLLATSAAASIILGLAIQDTLGNLFAGISLQIDRSFEIGDWVEVVSGIQRSIGQVKEISWRATVLVGLSDEMITIPNRFLANAQISNYSTAHQPVARTQVFRVDHEVDSKLVRQCLLESVKELELIRDYPAPLVLASDWSENGIIYKLIYYIDDYGSQWRVTDQVTDSALKHLQANGIEISPNRLLVIKSEEP
jgi:small-conductance mechanosensitive channel